MLQAIKRLSTGLWDGICRVATKGKNAVAWLWSGFMSFYVKPYQYFIRVFLNNETPKKTTNETKKARQPYQPQQNILVLKKASSVDSLSSTSSSETLPTKETYNALMKKWGFENTEEASPARDIIDAHASLKLREKYATLWEKHGLGSKEEIAQMRANAKNLSRKVPSPFATSFGMHIAPSPFQNRCAQDSLQNSDVKNTL